MVIDMNYWSKVFKNIIIVLLTIVGIYLAFKLAVFYMPFLIAFILSLVIEPIIKLIMKKTKLKRKTSAIIVFGLAFAIIIGLIVWGTTTIITEASKLLENLNIYFDKAVEFVENIISKIDITKLNIPEDVISTIQTSAMEFVEVIINFVKQWLTSILSFLTSIPTIGIYTAITFLALYFICVDRIYMLDQLEHHFPQQWVRTLGTHLRKLVKTLGGYLKAELILVLISFIISLIGLYIFNIVGLNVPYPLIAALLIGFIDLLPIFGSGFVMLPWAIISAFTGDITLGVSILILWAIMSIVRQFVEPKIVSGQIGIHPIFTLIAMYTGYKFIGILGMVIGPIVLIIIKNVFATLIDKGVFKTIFERQTENKMCESIS